MGSSILTKAKVCFEKHYIKQQSIIAKKQKIKLFLTTGTNTNYFIGCDHSGSSNHTKN